MKTFQRFAMLVCFVGPRIVSGDDGDVFTQRILPLAQADKPSSCRECHLAGVDLSQYILADEASTFAALRDAGLVDVQSPSDSKLLQFIRRSPGTGDEVLAKVRAEELAAFEVWIQRAVKNPALLATKAPKKPIGPEVSDEVIRYSRHDRVLQSFIESIWIERERCAGCHDPDRNQKVVAKHGEHISWISPDDPAGTLARIIENGLIDIDQPEKSLIRQKPLNEVEHGGHIKFPKGSRTDHQFRKFLRDYASVVKGEYKAAEDLPPASEHVYVVAGQHLRITGLPESVRGKLMRVTFHERTAAGWNAEPAGTADSTVNPKGVWQNPIFTIVGREGTTAADVLKERRLAGENYLVRMYLDRDGKSETDQDFEFKPGDFYQEVEISGHWKPGWKEPMILSLEK